MGSQRVSAGVVVWDNTVGEGRIFEREDLCDLLEMRAEGIGVYSR